MFNLKTPCAMCPFIEGGLMNQSLHPERMKDITSALRSGQTFTCHKTIDYGEQFTDEDEYGDNEFVPNQDNQFCAGALIYIEKAGVYHPSLQFAERLGMYDPKALKGHEKVINP